jgi:hypothetical protein
MSLNLAERAVTSELEVCEKHTEDLIEDFTELAGRYRKKGQPHCVHLIDEVGVVLARRLQGMLTALRAEEEQVPAPGGVTVLGTAEWARAEEAALSGSSPDAPKIPLRYDKG